MSIKTLFKQKTPLFIPFMMAGFPDLNQSINTFMSLSEAGADIIELGVPFSDPIADGPINQQAAHLALEKGINLDKIFTIISTVRAKGCNTPIILFSYYNSILAYGLEKFIIKANEVGANGVLIVDLPPEEGMEVYPAFKNANLDIILLASPTTDSKRFELYKKLDPVFIYYISRLGVTGIQTGLSESLKLEVNNLKQIFDKTPIAVGFGISNSEQAKEVASFADGVIIGSYLMQVLNTKGLKEFTNRTKDFVKNISHGEKIN